MACTILILMVYSNLIEKGSESTLFYRKIWFGRLVDCENVESCDFLLEEANCCTVLVGGQDKRKFATRPKYFCKLKAHVYFIFE